MPLFTLNKKFEHGGQSYGPGLVDASDAVYMAARGAGAVGEATAEEQPKVVEPRPIEARRTSEAAERTAQPEAPRRSEAKDGGDSAKARG